jgi:uncharacterized membrane protein
MLNYWMHSLALAVYLGSLAGLGTLLLPAFSAVQSYESRVELLVRSLKRYNPIQTGALGIMVLTGAFQVTDLKENYRGLFAQELGMMLAFKLVLSFVIIILGTYQTMGVAHRFVRQYEGEGAILPQDFQSLIRRLRASTVVIILVAILTVAVGVGMRD